MNMCEHEIDDLIELSEQAFSKESWATATQLVIDYYYKPGVVSNFKEALEKSPSEVDDYITLACDIARALDRKEIELKKAVVKAMGWNENYPHINSSFEHVLACISSGLVKKYTQAEVNWARMYANLRESEYNKALKAELKRQQENYGKLSAKYATLKKVVRDLRRIIDNFTK